MKCKPLVSIIIPAYNVQEYITNCLNSVQNQTYENIEIIVVNDASTDHTLQFIQNENYENKIHVINLSKNKGLGKCRNLGIDLALGEYIFFLDADDYIEKKTLSTIINFMSESSDICLFDGIWFEHKTGKVLHERYFYWININSNYFSRKKILKSHRSILFDCHSACLKLYSSRFLKKHSIYFPEKIYGEDVEFWFHCLLHTNKIDYINYKGYYRRVRNGSITNSKSIKNIKDRIDSFEKLLKLSSCDTDLYNYIISKYIPLNMYKAGLLKDKNLIKYAKEIYKKLIIQFG